MRRIALSLALASTVLDAQAQVFEDGFEAPRIAPLFPEVAGRFQLPPGPTATQWSWFLDKLRVGAVTTEAEVNAHFAPAWLAGINAAATVSFIHSVRDSYPDAYVADLITVTPTRVTATLRSPHNANVGYVVFGARFADTQRINFASVTAFNHNSVMFPIDMGLTMAQAADKFAQISSGPGLLVARIDASGACVPVEARNATTLRATASIFKTWVLGGAAVAVRDGALLPTTPVALTAADRAQPVNEGIALEANGTPVSVIDLARMMIGLSDNTATDHLHERLGRPVIDGHVSASGVADPDVLRPLLKINEQFHVFRTLTRTEADNYVGGTEAHQYAVVPQLEAFGTTFGGFFHTDLLVNGTWRASPMDICRNFAALRRFRGAAGELVDAAMGASVAQPNVRGQWNRAWYKGGSLAQSANNFSVYTHAWMLEREGEEPWVLVALSNSVNGGISGVNNPNALNDVFDIQSTTGRLLQLISQQ